MVSNIRALDAAIQSVRKSRIARTPEGTDAFGAVLAQTLLPEAVEALADDRPQARQQEQAPDLVRLAALMPSRENLEALAARVCADLAAAYAGAGLAREPAVELTVDAHGHVHAAGPRADLARIAAALGPALESDLRDLNAIASHACHLEQRLAGSGDAARKPLPLADMRFAFDGAGLHMTAGGAHWLSAQPAR
jgi:hypothetical protein